MELQKTQSEKDTIDNILEHSRKELKKWQFKLDEATQMVKYWDDQANAASILATRLTLESWNKSI